mmetsp:Transcript_5351/g.13034  ORF Transcript_5351/g.13034 Transcript_5351/m.13034 type:complete len:261 (+) Transcript_5351:737-1519(+)
MELGLQPEVLTPRGLSETGGRRLLHPPTQEVVHWRVVHRRGVLWVARWKLEHSSLSWQEQPAFVLAEEEERGHREVDGHRGGTSSADNHASGMGLAQLLAVEASFATYSRHWSVQRLPISPHLCCRCWLFVLPAFSPAVSSSLPAASERPGTPPRPGLAAHRKGCQCRPNQALAELASPLPAGIRTRDTPWGDIHSPFRNPFVDYGHSGVGSRRRQILHWGLCLYDHRLFPLLHAHLHVQILRRHPDSEALVAPAGEPCP